MRRPRVIVVGSINMDLVFRTPRLPRPGETVTGHSFSEVSGGKGANQAVAASRLGAYVSIVGRVGDDDFGLLLRQGLAAEGIDLTYVKSTSAVASGLAIIGVEDSGENAITVIPGANGFVTPSDVVAAEDLFREADVVLLQFEIPMPAVLKAIELARRHAVTIILDPAPAMENVSAELLQVDVLCPNETEAAAISGLPVDDAAKALVAAQRICRMGVWWSLITLGSKGAVSCNENGAQHVAPFRVTAVDTTGAGDAFAAGLGVGIAEGLQPNDAIRLASAAGALAATRQGAQSAMPTRDEVEQLLRVQN